MKYMYTIMQLFNDRLLCTDDNVLETEFNQNVALIRRFQQKVINSFSRPEVTNRRIIST